MNASSSCTAPTRLHDLPHGDDAPFSDPSGPFRVGYADTMAVVPPVSERRAGSPVALPPSDFSSLEMSFFRTLDTPAKVQDYLDTVPMDHEIQDDTCLSALEAVRVFPPLGVCVSVHHLLMCLP
jgi:hypothetical protein